MAIKVFCNICDKYIKDVTINESYNLKGTEVCISCKARVDKHFKDMDALQKQAEEQIVNLAKKTQAELNKIEGIYKKVQHRLTDLFSTTKAELEEMTRRVIEGEKAKDELPDLPKQ